MSNPRANRGGAAAGGGADDEKQPGGGAEAGAAGEAAFAFPVRDSNLRLEALVAMVKSANEENSCVSVPPHSKLTQCDDQNVGERAAAVGCPSQTFV